ncbi:MAG: AI-2E family transporter [Planctomycetaceae bacterium]
MSPRLSFWGLVAAAVLVGVFFFQFVAPFVLPLFMAGVLAILFRPLFHRLIAVCRGRRRIAAALTTIVVLLAFILPIGGGLYLAGSELVGLARSLQRDMDLDDAADWEREILDSLENFLSREQVRTLRRESSAIVRGVAENTYDQTRAVVRNVVSFVIGFAVMMLAVYFFLADGRRFLARTRTLLPIEDHDLQTLFEEFQSVCRSVVLATVVAAMVQAGLLAAGLTVIGVGAVWLFVGLTMILAMVPFVGAAGVYVPVAIWLFFQGRYAAAIGLLLYGGLIVSTVDNLVRAYLIRGKSYIHPLIVLVTVLGAVQEVGLWGVFIGPAVAAVLYALLKILHDRLEEGKASMHEMTQHPHEGDRLPSDAPPQKENLAPK